MILTKNSLRLSNIHGIGLFADEFIPKGTIVYKYVKDFDIIYSDEQFDNLPKNVQEYILHYGYYCKNEGGYVLCGDNGRFTNHSKTPNIQMLNNIDTIAIKDIAIDDEITENYYYFDEKVNLKNI